MRLAVMVSVLAASCSTFSFCAFAAPDEGTPPALFRDRAVSTLLKIEMAAGLLGTAGSEMATQV
jgi:hypothetical protein